MKYIPLYDRIREELLLLAEEDVTKDPRKCKAMAAFYEILDYCSEKIAENEEDLNDHEEEIL